jgi:predicted helicase
MEQLESHIVNELKKYIQEDSVPLIKICEEYYNRPVHSIADLKKRNTKSKGDIFECFAKLYMEKVYGLSKVYYYSNVPEEIKKKLKLSKNDMGIDLLGIDDNDNYYAIQAKYRKRNSTRKVSVTWKELSTFYALCLKTGPYQKHIVITTADYVRHIGNKTEKDQTITFNTLSKTNKFDWLKIVSDQMNQTVNKTNSETLTMEEMRQKRLEKLQPYL